MKKLYTSDPVLNPYLINTLGENNHEKIIILKLFVIFLLFHSPLIIPQYNEWLNFPYGSEVRDIKTKNEFIFLATAGGVVKINSLSNEMTIFNKANSGLPSNGVFQIAILSEDTFVVNCSHYGLARYENGVWQKLSPPFHDSSLSGHDGDNGFYFLDYDHLGRLLIGTWKGGHIFDGLNWSYFNTPIFNVNDYNLVTWMYTDSRNNLFVGTPNGLGIFDGSNWKKEPFGSIVSIKEDKNKTIWIYSNTKGLIKYDYDSVKFFNNENSLINKFNIPTPLYVYNSYWLSITKSGKIFLASFMYDDFEDREILEYDGVSWNQLPNPQMEEPITINGIVADSSKTLWLATSKGLHFYKNNSWEFINPSNNDLPTGYIRNLAVDLENNIWNGDYCDLIKYDGSTWKSYSIIEPSSYRGYIFEIDVDSNNVIWAALVAGLFSFDNGLVKQIIETDSIYGSRTVRLIEIDDSGNVWFTLDYALVKSDGNSFQNYIIPDSVKPLPPYYLYYCDMHFDNDSNLWILANNGLIKFNGKDWTLFSYEEPGMGSDVQSFDIDSKNNIWIGVINYGLVKFDGNNWTLYDETNSGLANKYVTALKIHTDDNIWTGSSSYSDGVNRNPATLSKFDGVNFINFDMNNSGFPDAEFVNDIVIDTKNNKWISTSWEGIIVYKENGLLVPQNNNSLSASINDNNIMLTWQVIHEMNNMNYEVERNTDGNWISIGNVEGNIIETMMAMHSFNDDISELPYFTTINYRFKQYQNNIFTGYSNEIIVNPTSIKLVDDLIPKQFRLYQNFPNPFNPNTKINYSIHHLSFITIRVYDILGREVVTLVNEEKPAGIYAINFNGSSLSSGIYFYRIQVYPAKDGAGSFTQTKKMILTK